MLFRRENLLSVYFYLLVYDTQGRRLRITLRVISRRVIIASPNDHPVRMIQRRVFHFTREKSPPNLWTLRDGRKTPRRRDVIRNNYIPVVRLRPRYVVRARVRTCVIISDPLSIRASFVVASGSVKG